MRPYPSLQCTLYIVSTSFELKHKCSFRQGMGMSIGENLTTCKLAATPEEQKSHMERGGYIQYAFPISRRFSNGIGLMTYYMSKDKYYMTIGQVAQERQSIAQTYVNRYLTEGGDAVAALLLLLAAPQLPLHLSSLLHAKTLLNLCWGTYASCIKNQPLPSYIH